MFAGPARTPNEGGSISHGKRQPIGGVTGMTGWHGAASP
ncbi:MAG: hypothetical protein OJF49_002393 [Ktedonobacterales bacterium]|nr:MAG: hypothetical protein OJF49_002393 [Ktedonobacterales bacterium]